MNAAERVDWIEQRLRYTMRNTIPPERRKMIAESIFRGGSIAGAETTDSWRLICDVVLTLWDDALLNEYP